MAGVSHTYRTKLVKIELNLRVSNIYKIKFKIFIQAELISDRATITELKLNLSQIHT